MKTSDWSIILLSDTHLGANSEVQKNGVIQAEKTLDCVCLIDTLKLRAGNSDLPVIHLGDVCGWKGEHPTKAHYDTARSIMEKFSPFVVIPGNHDDVQLLRESFPFPESCELLFDDGEDFVAILSTEHVQLLFFSTSEYSKRTGRLKPPQILIISDAVKRSSVPVLLMSHHPLVPCGSVWVDREMCVKNGQDLIDSLAGSEEKVLGFISGHTHRALTQSCSRYSYITVPSVAWGYSDLPAETEPRLVPWVTTGFSVMSMFEGQLQIRNIAL